MLGLNDIHYKSNTSQHYQYDVPMHQHSQSTFINYLFPILLKHLRINHHIQLYNYIINHIIYNEYNDYLMYYCVYDNI